ncbi:hypothetical protein D3C86_1883680 [compost metagenome]
MRIFALALFLNSPVFLKPYCPMKLLLPRRILLLFVKVPAMWYKPTSLVRVISSWPPGLLLNAARLSRPVAPPEKLMPIQSCEALLNVPAAW